MSFRTPLVAALLAAAALSVSAQVTSVNGQIAYVACGPSTIPFGPTEQCDIWVMNADGSGKVNLTDTGDQYEYAPAWSPDGTRIAYASLFDGALMVMNADGSNKTVVSPDGSSPTWSPAGTQLAFVRLNPGDPVATQWDVMVVDLVTGSEVVISRPASFGGVLASADEFEPVWSPDGGRIAFSGVRSERYLDPITGEPIEGGQYEIVSVNPDGSDELIVSVGTPGTDRANYLEEDRAPAWSPDSRMLVFMSQAQVPACCGPWQIWAVNRDGSGATNLTDDPNINDLWPSFSPDGTQIIFQRANGQGGFDLYSMPAPTTLPPTARARANRVAAVPITSDGNASDPDWGRNRDLPPPPASQYGLYVGIEAATRGATGTVTSAPGGIRCGRDCTQSYPVGRRIDLTATPRRGSTFVGWSGACTGSAPTCSVTMNDVRIVKARFRR